MTCSGSITVNGDVNVVGGSVISYASASDKRIKEDIRPLDDSDYEMTIERFMATPMYSYR
jgi:hypothetical protein